jgi:pimeloyl-ACP methyl ester carboxylesterase
MTDQDQAFLGLKRIAVRGADPRGLPPFTADHARLIKAPTLLVTGAESPAFLRPISSILADSMPRGELATMPCASHFMFIENPDAFNAYALDFLRRNA